MVKRGGRPARAGVVDLAVAAPAKVNLVLRVGRRRADGYHDIRSLLAPLDLADRVRVRVWPARPGPIRCRVPGRPELDGPSNLAARAAQAFRERFAAAGRVDIEIDKRIPVTAGLGGGSSDAAAVLRALARAHRVRDRAALAELALGIGSDVPFFLGPGAAWARGRGERLTPARVPRLHLVLAYPTDAALAVRAGDAYRWLDAWREGPVPAGPEAPAKREGTGRGPAGVPALVNDLEKPVLERLPALRHIRGLLAGAGASSAIMSGSGPTLIGVFAGREQARRAARAMEGAGRAGLEVHLARTVRRQPGVTPWRSPRSVSSPSTRRSSRPT